MKGLVIAGTHSGCGKTTIALGVMAALVQRGLKVAPFKVGPDFIDPGHHTRITNTTSRNIDGWMLSEGYNRECFRTHTHRADVAVVEGVMGLFDGYDGKSESGSTAQMAKWLGLPVILVVHAGSMARSAAALVQGFERFDPDLTFAGIVFNAVGSSRHLSYLREALKETVRTPCLGGIFRNPDIQIPERHLGLVTEQEHALSMEQIHALAQLVETGTDLPSLLTRLPEISWTKKRPPAPEKRDRPLRAKVRIGVARDAAFCFYYPDNLDLLARAGAELLFFSPIVDKALPRDLDGLYFGGGYPEVFARQLSGNHVLRRQVMEKSRNRMPIYGECGGFMYLCSTLKDMAGEIHPMAGCFPLATRMLQRRKALGYREVRLEKETIIGKPGDLLRGHEFHYSEIVPSSYEKEVETVYRVTGRRGENESPEGFRVMGKHPVEVNRSRTLGSYIHLHFGSRPGAAVEFVDTCREYRKERKNTHATTGH